MPTKDLQLQFRACPTLSHGPHIHFVWRSLGLKARNKQTKEPIVNNSVQPTNSILNMVFFTH